MPKTIVKLPTMYADHHVLAVRRALLAQPGVSNVVASSAFLQVEVEYDSQLTSPEAVRQVLAAAGYPEGEEVAALPRANGHGDPAWERLGVRATRSFRSDQQMSGVSH
jgi:copper chaperone CopZ